MWRPKRCRNLYLSVLPSHMPSAICSFSIYLFCFLPGNDGTVLKHPWRTGEMSPMEDRLDVKYLQQGLGHLRDLGDQLDQEDPASKQKTQKCQNDSHVALWYVNSSERIVCGRQDTHLFPFVTFASFLTGLTNLSLGIRNTHTVNLSSQISLASSLNVKMKWKNLWTQTAIICS